jgi:deaminated glutathione amidase
MSTTLRLCGVQMAVSRELSENLPRVLEHIRNAASDGADIVLFPEMSLSGYHGDWDWDAVQDAVAQVENTIRASGIAAIIGTGWIGDEQYIQLRAYGADGSLLGTHEKMMPTGIDGENGDREYCKPGKELRTFQWRGITCGMLICNDLWVTPGTGPYPDPRLTYQLGKMGAQILFHGINSGSSEMHRPFHESNQQLRAIESKLHIATANAACMDNPTNAASGLILPDGSWATKADRQGEGRWFADVTID